MSAVTYEISGPLAVITMTHEPHNLLGPELMQPLIAGLQRASSENARAVLLKSGLRHFSAGADMALFETGRGVPDFDPVATLRAFEHTRCRWCALYTGCAWPAGSNSR